MNTIKVGIISNRDVKTGVSKSNGKPYEIHKFYCTGTVDGVEDNSIVIDTTKTQADDIFPGKVLMCDPREWNGSISYRPVREQVQFGGGQAKPAAQGAQKQYSRSGYTLEEYETLFRHAADFILKLAKIYGFSEDVVVPMISTYIIGAKNEGLKPSGGPAMAAEKQGDDVNQDKGTQVSGVAEAIEQALTDSGLSGRVRIAGIPYATLESWWNESGHSKNMFVIRVNAGLGIEQSDAGEDNLPF